MESKHNRNLDILRGVAALVVVGYHLISSYPQEFDKNFRLGPVINYNFPGHMSVLVFFILSGYVIAANTRRLTDGKSIRTYIRKRLTRIVPIYIVAILFTAVISKGRYSIGVILANLFFVSVPMDNVMIEDGPLWSLNYELLYYFAFIAFSYYNISLKRTVQLVGAMLVLAFAFLHNVRTSPLVFSYLIGFLFWITGAAIAKARDNTVWPVSASRIIAAFILMFCLQPFNPYGPVLKVLKIPVTDYANLSWFQQSISWSDLYYYPLTILLILTLTHCYTNKFRYLVWFIYGSAILRLAMLFRVYNWDFIVKEHYVVPMAILLISFAFWVFNFEIGPRLKNIFKSASSLGSISYGVYVIHMPIIYFFGRTVATTWPMFLVKLLVYAATLLFVSWLLEHKFQDWIKGGLRKMLDKKSDVQPAVIAQNPTVSSEIRLTGNSERKEIN